MIDYSTLNPEQLKAVLHNKGPLLILAGAGSGKTRVLTHRIARLIAEEGVSPYQILAITFTNKAAKEMKERVERLVGPGSENMWISTFHSACVKILRRFIDSLGYNRSFTIYDTDDQKTLMREVCKFLNIDTKNIKERSILSAISNAKDNLISPEEFEASATGDYLKKIYARAYKEYQKRLFENNALDFDDIIVKTIELFRCDEQALEYYRQRFRYIMVDEYQDTNTAQFRFIQMLAAYTNEYGEIEHNLCVVGDDDQSIYKFRGANIRNILDFELEYPDAAVIKLEQNYRSTRNILDAANGVIHNNLGRKDKALWTDNSEGEPINFHQFENNFDEADFVSRDILKNVRMGTAGSYNDYAVLYRTNAQSRSLEESFVRQGIPYKVIGSINFYQRKEIKDLLAYLKTIDNATDSIAVKRIINVPKRGIGLATLDKIQVYAEEHGISFYDALKCTPMIPSINTGLTAKIDRFVGLIEGMRSNLQLEGYSLKQLLEDLLENTAYINSLEESDEDAEDRVENINELITKAAIFETTHEGGATLSDFLEEVALVADIDSLDADVDAVVLMTIHSAKGLEFPYLYLTGMEDGTFPGYMSINADDPETELEEERRLCYVGITRAMKKLTLSAAKQRMIRGEVHFLKTSRFINEIPRHLLSIKAGAGQRYINEDGFRQNTIRTSSSINNTQPSTPSTPRQSQPTLRTPAPRSFGTATPGTLSYKVGDSVRHLKFGVGTVTNIVQGGRDFEVTIDFPNFGQRKLLASFANLVKVE